MDRETERAVIAVSITLSTGVRLCNESIDQSYFVSGVECVGGGKALCCSAVVTPYIGSHHPHCALSSSCAAAA